MIHTALGFRLRKFLIADCSKSISLLFFIRNSNCVWIIRKIRSKSQRSWTPPIARLDRASQTSWSYFSKPCDPCISMRAPLRCSNHRLPCRWSQSSRFIRPTAPSGRLNVLTHTSHPSFCYWPPLLPPSFRSSHLGWIWNRLITFILFTVEPIRFVNFPNFCN